MNYKKLIEEMNQLYKTDWLYFDEKGMHFKLVGWLKDYFADHEIECEADFIEQVWNWPVLEGWTYFADSDGLMPFSLGLTDAPGWACGIIDRYADPDNPYGDGDNPPQPQHAWAFFERYQVVDWVEELLRDGEVCFETYANLWPEEEAADVKTYENCLEAYYDKQ